jgi:hypothetical protein
MLWGPEKALVLTWCSRSCRETSLGGVRPAGSVVSRPVAAVGGSLAHGCPARDGSYSV